jgi:type VI secretion system secreted protein VgrG
MPAMSTSGPLSHFSTVTSPLGQDALILSRMTGREVLSEPFELELELYSKESDIDPTKVLGESMTVHLEIKGDQVRHWNGITTRFTRIGSAGRYSVYLATLRPWTWLLKHSVDCRVFQKATVVDVIKAVFRAHGFSDVVDELHADPPYRSWEYLVQYRESAHAFVSRLMEQEGIYYFFKHEDGLHKLVLADALSSHGSYVVPEYETLPYYPPDSGFRERDHIDHWHVAHELQPEKYVLADFNYKTPGEKLLADHKTTDATDLRREYDTPATPNGDTPQSRAEIYDYPGEFEQQDEAPGYARLRLEAMSARRQLIEAQGTVRGLGVGNLFTLEKFPREAQNREYLVTAAHYHFDAGIHESGLHASAQETFRGTWTVLPSNVPFRAPCVTPKPLIVGPQTATVVGPKGEEIWTEDGCVRVQFHWDRVGKRDLDSSCNIRVAQIWAGSGWGAQFIPRIGHEVIVEFLEGDPDRPIITGCVYNGDNKVPYSNKAHSGIKTHTTKNGGTDHYNELRFEDDRGKEKVFLQAEKDLSEQVKNDHSTHVGHSQTNAIEKDHTETVGGKQSLDVTGIRTVHIKGSQSVTIDGKEAADGVSGSKLGVTGDYNVDVSKTIHVQAPKSITLECGGSKIVIEPNQISIIAGGKAALVLNGTATLTSPQQVLAQIAMEAGMASVPGPMLKLGDGQALMSATSASVEGDVTAKIGLKALNEVIANALGVTVTGTKVKVN